MVEYSVINGRFVAPVEGHEKGTLLHWVEYAIKLANIDPRERTEVEAAHLYAIGAALNYLNHENIEAPLVYARGRKEWNASWMYIAHPGDIFQHADECIFALV